VLNPKAYGIDEKRWNELTPLMAQQAMASGSPGNNPIMPSVEEMQLLYSQVWEGQRRQPASKIIAQHNGLPRYARVRADACHESIGVASQ
jgi:hypothetical protein